ncbi:hypothetical protein DQ04_22461000, partial [Trypanosoma grayi]|uniref:hypothetical protein n=1 Tax=Trypanosoma grayi TaxID=71804 RepID=UPI0004F417A2
AAVGRPALFVVAVVLCCVCGCAAAPDVSDNGEDPVIVNMKQAKEKAIKAKEAVDEAKKAVDAVKSATEQFKTAAETASLAADKLNEKVKKGGNIDKEDTVDGVTSLANKAESTTRTSHKSFVSLCEKVKEAADSTKKAETLLKEAEGMAGSAANDADGVISKGAKHTKIEIVKLSEELSSLTKSQKCSEEAEGDEKKKGNAFQALKNAEKVYTSVQPQTASTSLTVTQQQKNDAEEAAKLAKAAAGDAAAASSSAGRSADYAGKAVSSAESWLGQVEAALQAVNKLQEEPEHLPAADQPPPLSPSELSKDESQSQSLQQDPLSSTSNGGKTSDQQQ